MTAKITIGIALLLGSIFHAFAQMTAYANIYAEVVAPVGVEKISDLTFSNIISSKAGKTVVLGADNLQTLSDIELTQNEKGTVASFSVTGNNLSTFDVTLPKESFAVSDGSSKIMTVSNFTSASSLTNNLQASNSVIKIGASLYVPENQSTGNYNTKTPFNVTLNYN